jgi:predicted Zn-dependent peptidase
LDNVKKEDLVSVAKKYLTNTNVLKAVMNPETK